MTCPKCGGHIGTFDLKPNCKHCGVNIILYTQEHELIRDAKRAELEFASARIVVAKIKAAFIGSKPVIARLVLVLLCVATLLIPFAGVKFALPLFEDSIDVSGLGVYNLFSGGLLSALTSFASDSVFGGATVRALVIIALLVLIALMAVAMLVTEILSFLNLKKSAKLMAIFAFIAAGIAVAAQIIALVFGAGDYPSFITFKAGFGGVVAALFFAAFGVLNLKLFKTEIPVTLKPNDPERKELLKKVKAGEVSLDDLPLPIFETEEEKAERMKALSEAMEREEGGYEA